MATYQIEMNSPGGEGTEGSSWYNERWHDLPYWLDSAGRHFVHRVANLGLKPESFTIQVRSSDETLRTVVTANVRDDKGNWKIGG